MKEKILSTVKSLTLRTVTSEPIARRFSAHFVLDIQQRTKFEHLKVRTHHLKPPSDTPILSIYGEKKPFRCDICSRNFSSENTYFEVSHYLHTQNPKK